MENLEQRTALVTGGSRGIGPYIARALAKEGVRVVLTARSERLLAQAAASLADLGERPLVVPADLQRAGDRERLIAAATRHFGRIEILVNNAGIESEGAFAALSQQAIDSTIGVNLVAPLALARQVLPGMVANGSGHIVSIASLGGKRGVPYDAVYCATKAGLIEWSHALREEVAGYHIHVSVICPGYVTEVGMFARFGMKPPLGIGSCTPEQVANAVVRALRYRQREVIVNSIPVRPFLALGALSPALLDWLVKRMGVTDFQRRKVTQDGRGSV
ncbi:MAG: SDR family NAD(P)-dependent oxidoreductase [Gammaproteobacteria bacterium]|nr:SDR family NAD(P)-dependent oxidoreductase [Gammaproteobacteria bacterium]